LDEFALSTQRQLRNYQETLLAASSKAPRIPFCAFNGGSDVWVDIGNKLIGVQILQEFIKANGHETLHVGDQFLSTGNDIATRSASCTIWITSPKETGEILHELISMMDEN
jgi:IMP and pyridine-specific 5'-nucleotidase